MREGKKETRRPWLARADWEKSCVHVTCRSGRPRGRRSYKRKRYLLEGKPQEGLGYAWFPALLHIANLFRADHLKKERSHPGAQCNNLYVCD